MTRLDRLEQFIEGLPNMIPKAIVNPVFAGMRFVERYPVLTFVGGSAIVITIMLLAAHL